MGEDRLGGLASTKRGAYQAMTIRVTVWNEFRHEKRSERVREVYPEGIHKAIGQFLQGDFAVKYACLDDPDHGLTPDVLDETDVLIWWGHIAHREVRDEIVERVYKRVLDGMGFIALHSAHFAKPFVKLMGTSCALKWRDKGEKERLWVVSSGHPIVDGIDSYIELDKEEMYGEYFDIPEPDQLVFVSWFAGGEVFRSGCCYHRGRGKIFYFQPGHETFPTFHNAEIQKVIRNAVKWAAPIERPKDGYDISQQAVPLENIEK